jgi:hypothetical protein
VTTPGWNDVLRFAPGAKLRVELMLGPALRQAVQQASAGAARWLHMLDGGAALHVLELSPTACRLHCSAEQGSVDLHADLQRLQAQATIDGRSHQFGLTGLMLQTGGPRDTYLSAPPSGAADGGPQPFSQLHYGNDATVLVCLFRAPLMLLLGERIKLAPAARCLLPARFELLRLVAAEDPLPS